MTVKMIRIEAKDKEELLSKLLEAGLPADAAMEMTNTVHEKGPGFYEAHADNLDKEDCDCPKCKVSDDLVKMRDDAFAKLAEIKAKEKSGEISNVDAMIAAADLMKEVKAKTAELAKEAGMSDEAIANDMKLAEICSQVTKHLREEAHGTMPEAVKQLIPIIVKALDECGRIK